MRPTESTLTIGLLLTVGCANGGLDSTNTTDSQVSMATDSSLDAMNIPATEAMADATHVRRDVARVETAIDAIDSAAVDAACASWSFAPVGTYDTGVESYPVSVAVGDFNGDGHPDLALPSEGFVGVFLNQGDGSFGAQTVVATGGESYFAAIGDFDLDGRPDFAVANVGSLSIGIAYNNGAGAFANADTYPTNGNSTGVATGDFNGDGLPDIAVVNQKADWWNMPGVDSIGVFINQGDGTFAPQVTYETLANSSPSAIAVGDFNGDGYPDLAVTSFYYTSAVGIYFNDGQGQFAPQVTYAAGSNPFGITVGDFNGDGAVDIAIANWTGNSISVVMNLGDGAFAPEVVYPAGSYPQSVDVGDFNGDGFADIVVDNSGDLYGAGSSVGVYINQGDGTFAPQVTFDVGKWPNYAAAGDFNGDGRTDVAVACSGMKLCVLLNRCD